MSDTRADAITPEELRELLHLSPATYYRALARGTLDRFALVPRIGPRRFSRKAVQAYLDREAPAGFLRKVGTR